VSLYLVAGVMFACSAVLVGPLSTLLAGSKWVGHSPCAAVALWQAIGVSASISAIGAGLCVAVARFHASFATGLGDLLRGLVDGHPLRGLGLPDALGLTLATDLGVVLVSLAGFAMVRTVQTRARHRRLLNLLADASPHHPGTDMLVHPDAVAYCLPGFRPRIVISTGTVLLLDADELAAVIDHERGHALEHHGLVMLPMSGLTDLFRWIPYARLAPPAVAALLEMAADDHAARHYSPASLASALVQMGTSHSPPACAFAAGAIGLPARVTRLLDARRTSARAAFLAGVGAAGILALPIALLALA
jgi:Zn-dependent protease with chaperone function